MSENSWYKPVFDIPPSIVKYPVSYYDFVFTGPGDLGALDSGMYINKLYWYFYLKLVDVNGQYLGHTHPEGRPEFIELRYRVDNGVKKLFTHDTFNVGLVFVVTGEEGVIVSEPFFMFSDDNVKQEVRVIQRSPEVWAKAKRMSIAPVRTQPDESFEGGGIPYTIPGIPIFGF